MRFFLVLLWAIYFSFFYFFSKIDDGNFQSFFPSIFWESFLYLFLSFLSLISVSRLRISVSDIWDDISQETNTSWKEQVSFKNITQSIFYFFETYLYYIALLCLYFSNYLFIRYFWEDYSLTGVFFIFNVLALWGYILSKKFQIFYNMIQVNALIVSLYYIYYHILYLFFGMWQMQIIDFINVFCLFCLFLLFLRSEHTQKKERDRSILYIFLFLYLEISVLIRYFFPNMSMAPEAYIGLIFPFIFFFFTKQLQEITLCSKQVFRFLGLIFSAFTLAFGIFLIFHQEIEYIPLFVIYYILSWMLYLFHVRFFNISALFLSLLWLLLSSYYFLWWTPFGNNQEISSYIFLGFSFAIIAISRYLKLYKKDEVLMFSVVSLIVNLSSLILFFIFTNISILSVWMFLALESFFLFLLYFHFKRHISLWK